ncbi:MAG: (4Fe-4S)-binding protein [Clostridia bacterium]|nr:(4Fe-4S)-binding protein [Clostridia bacterium]
MMSLTTEQINSVKGRGFLRNRGTDCFSGRILACGTVFTAENMRDIATLAETYGNGTMIPTARQCIEVPAIPFDRIPDAEAFAAAHGLIFGGTGPKVRPVTACKGTTCVFGCYDTQALAKKIHETYYTGWNSVKLPHKFKIGVGGCPNSCIKPSLNDFGIEGRRVAGQREAAYQIYVGGTWGKTTRMGTPLSRLVSEEEILPILEKTLLWFRENAYVKERLGNAVDRIGADKLEKALFSEDLIRRKQEILAAALKER